MNGPHDGDLWRILLTVFRLVPIIRHVRKRGGNHGFFSDLIS